MHQRILYSWPLPSHGLILEKYQPSEKWNEPYLQCSYLGTSGGLSRSVKFEKSYTECTRGADRCAKLKTVYSRFRPVRREDEMTRRRPLLGTVTAGYTSNSSTTSSDASARPLERKVVHMLYLDSHELFTQMCLTSSFVKLGPVPGVFPNVFEAAGGVIRVWRAWLSERAISPVSSDNFEHDADYEKAPEDDRNVLWVDWRHHIGLRVRVLQVGGSAGAQWPVVDDWHDPDERPVAYAIEILELIIRTSHLVLAIERSIEEQRVTSGKAMIFGSLDSASRPGTVQV